MKGSKRYGRRSTPEFIEPISDHSEVRNTNLEEEEEVGEDNDDAAVPRKREVKVPDQDPDRRTLFLSPPNSQMFVANRWLAVSCYS